MKRWLTLTCLLIFSSNLYAWWDLGHMTVAHIAYQSLTPQAKTKIDALVSTFNKVYPEIQTFEDMSRWPDMLHTQQKIYLYYHRHFIDVPFSADQTPTTNTINSDNVIRSIVSITRTLDDKQVTNEYECARLVALLSHFVGDIHQPLHTVTRISATNPRGDLGGNKFAILENGNPSNIHKIWDNGFGRFADPVSQAKAIAISDDITKMYPKKYFGEKIHQLDPNIWAHEGMDNALKYVYRTPQNKEPSFEYKETGKKVSAEQVALAGYRLAELLNSVL